MALSRPLTIAVVAMVLLVGSVTFEVVFHRSYSVEVYDGAGWATIGETRTDDGAPPSLRTAPDHPILTARNASVDFRLRVDNGYPWSSSQHYDVIVNGLRVASGTVSATARGVGEAPFSIPASTLLSTFGTLTKDGGPASNITYANFYAQVGSQQVYATFQLQEAR